MEPTKRIFLEPEPEEIVLTEAEKAQLNEEFAGFDPSILAEIDPNDGIPIFEWDITLGKSFLDKSSNSPIVLHS